MKMEEEKVSRGSPLKTGRSVSTPGVGGKRASHTQGGGAINSDIHQDIVESHNNLGRKREREERFSFEERP